MGGPEKSAEKNRKRKGEVLRLSWRQLLIYVGSSRPVLARNVLTPGLFELQTEETAARYPRILITRREFDRLRKLVHFPTQEGS